jgi:Tfp pilus assembly protein PilZ
MASKAKKKEPMKKVAKKTKAPAAKSSSAKKVDAKAKKKEKLAAAPKKKEKEVKAAPVKRLSEKEKRRSLAAKALEDVIEDHDVKEEDEFDPEAFFAASGGKGIFRSHVMRKERVDFHLEVRYRFLKDPIVYTAELINLSKGGLALKTNKNIKAATVLKVEIPLPHTSELFSIQVEVVWSHKVETDETTSIHTGTRFLPMSLAKQSVINHFIQQRRDELVMAKIGLDKFTDSVPVAGID